MSASNPIPTQPETLEPPEVIHATFCSKCGQTGLHNTRCSKCGNKLGFEDEIAYLRQLQQLSPELVERVANYLEGNRHDNPLVLAHALRRAAVTAPRGDVLLEIIKQVTKKHHQSRTHPPTYCCPEDESVYDRLFARMLVEAIDAATSSPTPAESVTCTCLAAGNQTAWEYVHHTNDCPVYVAGEFAKQWLLGHPQLRHSKIFQGAAAWDRETVATLLVQFAANAAPAERTRVAGAAEEICAYFGDTELAMGGHVNANGVAAIISKHLAATSSPTPAESESPSPDAAIELLEKWLQDSEVEHDEGLERLLRAINQNSLSDHAPAERTRVEGEQSYSEGFDDAARVARVLSNVATSDSARRAAEEIADLSYNRHRDDKVAQYIAIISKHFESKGESNA